LNLSLYDTGSPTSGWFVQGSPNNGPPVPVPANAVAGSLVAPSAAAGTLVIGYGSNLGVSDGETNMDISLASTVAQGAKIALYIFDGTVMGWINALGAAALPAPGKPAPTVISSSYYYAGGDDSTGATEWGHATADFDLISAAFQDAAMMNVTVCMASGDTGSDCKVNDGYAHVIYPASDPWVLACGGTSIGDIKGATFREYVWNDYSGATGGGVSAHFPRPAWQATVIPFSLNPPYAFFVPSFNPLGRGVPDVAANASQYSAYPIYQNGMWEPGAGTSAAAPLIAGLIAQANAAIGHNVGFLNGLLYSTFGKACRRVPGGHPLGNGFTPPPSPADNSYNGVTGYRADSPGWNPCTGWGVFDWTQLINILTKTKEKEKEKEKEKDKDGKDLDKVHIKEEWEVKSISEYIPFPETGDPWEIFQTLLGAQTLGQVNRVLKEVGELRAFIRPEERPASGERALKKS